MIWDISIGHKALKVLTSLPKPQRLRISDAIDKLKYGPYQKELDIKPLHGRPEWRLRVGDWRVIFLIFENEIKISVVSISPRGDAYKK
ncbi:MAG: type II toxin-antitoxin system RelE/ParE family toxin [Synergistaceae bacterium]|nr:type II toxin-antitoxin system RelE/ParE family toxin [Synergistaceae bacterium]